MDISSMPKQRSGVVVGEISPYPIVDMVVTAQ
jgi:hypothetical protein